MSALKPGPQRECPGGEPADCACGHSWEEHHHCCIMNPAYPGEDHAGGAHRGVTGDECEAQQHEGRPLNGEYSCFCSNWHLKCEKGRGKRKCTTCNKSLGA